MTTLNIAFVAFIGVVFSASCISNAQPQVQGAIIHQVLSVGDTIALALNRYYETPPYKLETRGNPAAKAALYLVLNDSRSDVFWPGVLRMLGYVGDGADAKKIVTFLEELPREPHGDVINTAVYALAVLRQRQQEGASDLLERIVQPKFWQEMHFRPDKPVRASGRLPFDIKKSYDAIAAIARVDLPYAISKANEVQASIVDSGDKALFRKYVDTTLHDIAAEQKEREK